MYQFKKISGCSNSAWRISLFRRLFLRLLYSTSTSMPNRSSNALVLGINVEEWYSFKNHTILLPKQDYLDNLVWIYNRMIQFNIQGEDSLKDYIQKKYEQYFYDVYGRFMDFSDGMMIIHRKLRQGLINFCQKILIFAIIRKYFF